MMTMLTSTKQNQQNYHRQSWLHDAVRKNRSNIGIWPHYQSQASNYLISILDHTPYNDYPQRQRTDSPKSTWLTPHLTTGYQMKFHCISNFSYQVRTNISKVKICFLGQGQGQVNGTPISATYPLLILRHACTYVRMHGCTHARMHGHMQGCTDARMHARTDARTHGHTHVCTCVHAYVHALPRISRGKVADMGVPWNWPWPWPRGQIL